MSYQGQLVAEENKRRDAARAMLKALRHMRAELEHMDGYWTESMDNFAQEADAAIEQAEAAGITTGEDE